CPADSRPTCLSRSGCPMVVHETWSHQVVRPQSPAAWIWHGLIAPGRITLVTGPARVGKTRFLGTLLGHRHLGNSLLGLPVQPGKTFLVTDENIGLWRWRFRMGMIDVSDTVRCCCLPFCHPNAAEFE